MVNHVTPICACCRRDIHSMWSVTSGPVYVICGDGNCEGWARSQGLTIHTTGVLGAVRGPRRPPRRKRAPKPECVSCGIELPGRKRERFHADQGRAFCTLTCLESGVLCKTVAEGTTVSAIVNAALARYVGEDQA